MRRDATPIRPCPFCGSKALEIYADPNYAPVYVSCIDCGASGPDFEAELESDSMDVLKGKAVAAWNRAKR